MRLASGPGGSRRLGALAALCASIVWACSSAGTTPVGSAIPTVILPSPAASISSKPSCPSNLSTENHQSPEIEAVLPATVAGRSLARWSVRGRCWLEVTVDTPAHIDELVALVSTPGNPNPVNDTDLVYGVAGRSDTKTDPPYFVFAAVRPQNPDEIDFARFLLLGGAGYIDIEQGADLRTYEQETIGGKQVYVGTPGMIDQSEHQRGRPYLYQNEQYMFLVITDDDAWAVDAFGQLP